MIPMCTKQAKNSSRLRARSSSSSTTALDLLRALPLRLMTWKSLSISHRLKPCDAFEANSKSFVKSVNEIRSIEWILSVAAE